MDDNVPGFSAQFFFREFYRLLGNLEADGDVEAYSDIVNMRMQLGEVTQLHESVTFSNLSKVLKDEKEHRQCHIPFAIYVNSITLPPFAPSVTSEKSLHVFSGHYTYGT